MAKEQSKRPLALEKLAKLEVLLGKLVKDQEAATFHQNRLVADKIESAARAVVLAREALFADDLQKFARFSNAAWLHISFGRQLLDSDSIEHLLGEDDFLELAETPIPRTVLIERYFGTLETEILKLRAVLSDRVKTH